MDSHACVSLPALVGELKQICLQTRGHNRRLNQFLLGAQMIVASVPSPLRDQAEHLLLNAAHDCGLLATTLADVDSIAAGALPSRRERPVLSLRMCASR